jgi:Flp pilus assembly protein TadB
MGYVVTLILLCVLMGFWVRKWEQGFKFRQFMLGIPMDRSYDVGLKWLETLFPFAPARSLHLICILFCTPLIGGIVIGWMKQRGFPLIMGGVSALSMPWIGYKLKSFLWRRRCRIQMKETLHLASTALRAGTTFAEALARAALELPQPMKGLLIQAGREIRLGKPEGEAFHSLVEMTGERTFSPLTGLIALTITKGGKLANTLDDALSYMEEDEELLADLRGETSSYRMSAYLLPLLLMGLILWFWPAIEPMMEHRWFFLLFLAAMGFMGTGIFLTFRLVRKLDV